MLSDVTRRVRTTEPTPPTADDPSELGGYEIRGRLGQGGMGVVYLGATRSGRLLAIKVIHPERTDESEFRARFRREVSAATKVRSRRTAAVVDFDVDAPRPWLATEYVPGPTLAQAIAEVGSLPEEAVRELVTGLAEALDAIHREGLVHRDVKPANVLLGPDGPVLIDMGIVFESDATSLTTTGMQPGTPQFMSPEQARGEAVTAATDVWSLGAVTHLAAAGTPPFGTGSLATVTYRIVHETPHLDALPPGLHHLVGACLAKDPAGRPTTSGVLASLADPPSAEPAGTGPTGPGLPDEDTVLRTETSSAATTTPGRPEAPRSSDRVRRRVLTGLVAAGLVLAGGGVAAAVVHFLASDDTPVVATPQVEVSTSAGPSGEPSPTAKKPKPSATPESSPVATPVGEQGATPTSEQDAAPARFQPGAVTIPAQIQVGQKISAEATGWTPQPAATKCLWSIGGEERDNLGSCTYTVALDDVGKSVQVRLTAARSGYTKAVVLSDATATVPQPSVQRPSCSITLRPGVEHAGWLAHCGIEQDPDVTYTWAWVDIDSGETITQEGEAGYTVGPSMWVRGSHKGNRVTVTVTAQREGYRSAEFSTTSTMPADYVPAG
ncbi:Serine/threonine protein kinase [Promicromonospora umidemergens]|uniref:Protein kinase domain-containing protein n=1 Tax=Promicromonospora umidemergens TaxID=629679 RepID=A0ABP8X9G0_9MICO|nr:serine/threonine-protein kinase [Promicromonospora umidemergens]MCP2281379.1 Serine/threonine protein kinase [Promicromonospora umidemergens]